ncbi:PQQ-binding-like beta-propeller repeat protein [Kribbella sp. NBC_00382]|uniref:outer membrane protein assembly factor BamB family protein n=1 Tax=Kribbella sp. NBC_00382 TaxID=2975967 RepID=UPI002E20F79B
MLQAGGAIGLTAAVGLPAAAATRTKITDLGPALVQFALMSSVLVGDVIYIGTRNTLPARVVAFHVPTRKVIGQTDLTTGYAIQAIAADPTGRYLYAGVLQKSGGPQANLHRWDLSTPDQPAVPIGRIGDRDVRDITVAPDGVVFAVGGGSPTAPALWQYDPGTGAVSNLGVPDPASTLARAVAATSDAVFFGAGSTLGGGGTTSRASLFAYDRAGGGFANITPREMLADPSLRDFAVVGDRLLAGSAGGTEPAKIAIIELADTSKYKLATLSSQVTKMYAADGDTVYYATDSLIESISLSTAAVTKVPFDGPSLGEVWGVEVRAGKVEVVSGYGFVAEIDPATRGCVVTDLIAAGAPAGPQAVMGIAAGCGFVYVGGNGTIARHSLHGGPTKYVQAPGEAKDAEVIDGVLYTGQYNSQGIWTYDPKTGRPPRQLAEFPGTQNRPLDTCWDADNRRLLVAVQSDTEGGGALWTYLPDTKKAANFPNPIDGVQLVRAVAVRRGIAYLGGDNAQTTGPRGTVVAFDPVRGKELWRIESGQAYGVGSLTVHGKYLYGMALKGGFFVIDLDQRKIVHTADHRPVCPQWSSMVLNRGRIYVASDTTLMRFDPKTFAMTVVAAQLNGGWYSGSHVNHDEHGVLYTMRGTNLVAIDDRV